MQRDISTSSYLPSAQYSNYPPTCISENVLTTASYAAGTSSINAGPTTIFSWAHTVPTYMPWAPKQSDGASSPPTTAPVVRFTAPQPCTSQTATTWELIYNLGTSCYRNSHSTNPHLKRRVEQDDEEWRASKQYISEEKMAAKMGQLHISCKSTTETEAKNSLDKLSDESSSDSNLVIGPSDQTDEFSKKTLTLSEELKKLIHPDPFMLKTIVKDTSKPNMALVLWQPPGGAVKQLIRDSLESSSKSKKSPKSSSHQPVEKPFERYFAENNNNVGAENLNLVTNQSLFEPGPMVQTLSVPDLDEEMEL